MSAIERTTMSENIEVTAREIDFVTRFALNWDALREIMGITRPIRKEPGAVLKSKRATVVLQSGSVSEGDLIPLSEAFVEEIPYSEMTLEKYKKSVTAEAIKNHGYEAAVAMTDEEFMNQLQFGVMGRFYNFIKGGELTSVQTSWQMALSMAKGIVVNKWKKMHRTATEVVAFVNIIDVYQYIGAANITIQSKFGFNYIKDFMGYSTVFLGSDEEVARGMVYATPTQNIVNYYLDPSNSDFARAGLVYTVDGETNLIGFHTEADYNRAVSNCYALLGLILFAEYIDGIAAVKYEASGSIGSISGVSTAAGEETGDSVLTLPTTPAVPGEVYYFKAQESTAPAAPTYLTEFDPTGWKLVKNGDTVETTNGHKYRIVGVNGSGQVIATTDGTVVAKT